MTPDEIRNHVAASLAASHPGQDVKVDVGPVPYGNWIWDEQASRHVSFTTGELFRTLGFSFAIRAWLRTLPKVGFDPGCLKSQ